VAFCPLGAVAEPTVKSAAESRNGTTVANRIFRNIADNMAAYCSSDPAQSVSLGEGEIGLRGDFERGKIAAQELAIRERASINSAEAEARVSNSLIAIGRRWGAARSGEGRAGR
jgi:hypothetical protein